MPVIGPHVFAEMTMADIYTILLLALCIFLIAAGRMYFVRSKYLIGLLGALPGVIGLAIILGGLK